MTFITRFNLLLTLLCALLLTFVPMPEWTVWIRPLWVPLVFCFWAQNYPDQVGVGLAWILGLLMDLMLGTLLGVHALLLSLFAFVIAKFHKRWRVFPSVQQAAVIFILMLLYLCIQYWIHGLLGRPPGTWKYWLPALSSALLWPPLSSFLLRFKNQIQIN